MQFFQIHPYNGAVSIKRSLTDDRAYSTVYEVGLYCILYIYNLLLDDWYHCNQVNSSVVVALIC